MSHVSIRPMEIPLGVVLRACSPYKSILKLGHHAIVYLPAEMLQQSATSVTGENDWISKVWLCTHFFGVNSDLHNNSVVVVSMPDMLLLLVVQNGLGLGATKM